MNALRQYINRYPTLDRKHALHRALEILAHLDDDCSGGISFEEFKQFCNMYVAVLAYPTDVTRDGVGDLFFR